MEITQRTILAINSTGTKVAIIETQHYKTTNPLSGTPQSFPTIKELATEDGHPVNALKDGTFQDVFTDEILRAV